MKTHHYDFNPLSHRIGLVILFLSKHTGEVAELPDGTALTAVP